MQGFTGTKQRAYCEKTLAYCAQHMRSAHWAYFAKFIYKGKELIFRKVIQVDVLKDFERNFMDSIILKVALTVKDYQTIVFPNRKDFKVTLIREELHEAKDFNLTSPRRFMRTYRGKLMKNNDSAVSTTDSNTPQGTQSTHTDKQIINIEIQLIEMSGEWLAKCTSGGILGDCTAMDALRFCIGKQIELMEVDEGLKLTGVDVVTPDIQDKKNQMVIPHGTPTMLAPDYLQKECGGIYHNGIGAYIHYKHVYVYPLYDFSRFDKEKRKFTFVVVPRGVIGEQKRTFVVNGEEVLVVVSGEINQIDPADVIKTNTGNGKTVFNPRKMMEGAVKLDNNQLYVNAASYIEQFVDDKREDKMDFAPFSQTPFMEGTAQAKSELAALSGRTFTCLWEYANPYLVQPGTPCRVVYFKNDVKHELKGMICQHNAIISLDEGMHSFRYRCNVGLVLFVQRPSDEQTI